MITAEHVARALVAACRDTDEDPVKVASREPGAFRSRHYAMWALLHVFPDLKPKLAATFVGCSYKATSFFDNSKRTVIPGSGRKGASWWNNATYQRVIEAIESDAPPPAPLPPPYKPPPPPKPRAQLGTMENGGYRPPPGTTEAVLNDDRDIRPVFDRGRIGVGAKKPRDHYDVAPDNKRALQDELRQAVANTVKMTPKEAG